MTIPTFEKPSSFILFIGIGGLIYILSFLIKSGENAEQKRYDGVLKILQLEYDEKLDSTDVFALTEKIERIKAKINTNDSIEVIKNIELVITKKIILNKKRDKEISIIYNDIINVSKQYKYDSTGFWPVFALIVIMLWTILGVIFLFKEHEQKNSNDSDGSMKCETGNKHYSMQRLKDFLKNKSTYKLKN